MVLTPQTTWVLEKEKNLIRSSWGKETQAREGELVFDILKRKDFGPSIDSALTQLKILEEANDKELQKP